MDTNYRFSNEFSSVHKAVPCAVITRNVFLIIAVYVPSIKMVDFHADILVFYQHNSIFARTLSRKEVELVY